MARRSLGWRAMGKIEGESTAEVEVPIDEVYALVEDVEIAPEWQASLVSMEALERDDQGRATLVRTVADVKVKKSESDLLFSYEPPLAVRWKQVKGEVKAVDGAWELEDLGDGRTKITFKLALDPGRMLDMLIRGPARDIVRQMLVGSKAGELEARLTADRQ